MATKLFLRNTTTNGITDTGDAVVYDMVIAAGASADTDTVTLTAGGTDIQWTQTAGGNSVAWISGRVPSGGFTLTSADFSGWFEESNMNDEAGGRLRVYKYTPGTPTITELGGPFDDGVEFGTTVTEMTWTANVTDTAFAEDDRILIRVLATNITTMTAGTAAFLFNAADAADGDSFFNIAETVTFKTESVSHATSGTLSAPGAVLDGTAAHIAKHTTSGVLAGQGSAIVGAASSATERTSSGALTGPGSTIAGTAARTREHDTTGVLTGPGSTVTGAALLTASTAVVIDVFADDRQQKRFKRRQEKLREDLVSAYNNVFGIAMPEESEPAEIVSAAKENFSQAVEVDYLEVERRVLEKLISQYERMAARQAVHDRRALEDEWDTDAVIAIAQALQ